MDGFWASVWDIWSTVTGLGTMVAIVVCFTKGRPWLGWFGVFMTGTGIALWFEMFRMTMNDEMSQLWLLLFHLQGLAVFVLLGAMALQPAKDGSWWYRRQMTGLKPVNAFWAIMAFVVAGLAAWTVVANVIWNLAEGGSPMWLPVVLIGTVATSAATLGFWLLRRRGPRSRPRERESHRAH